jgi:hypothetical protein
MNDPAAAVTVTLRIPDHWSHPRELVQRLPAGCRLTPEALLSRQLWSIAGILSVIDLGICDCIVA